MSYVYQTFSLILFLLFVHAILDAKFGRFTDDKKYSLRVSLGLGRTVEPGLWVGAEAQSWEPNRLLSSAGVSSLQLNTSLLSLCLGGRVNMPYPERRVYKQIQREIIFYSSENNNSDFT